MDAPVTFPQLLAGRFRIMCELGRGGMATVYLAEDTAHSRQVALKLLHTDLAATVGADRFLREIAVTARLSHPHILPLLESGTTEGQPFYVMPYVEGESLRAHLEREPQLAIDEAISILRDLASALDYAHRHGVVHRDLKPENVLLADAPPGGASLPLLADFGIAAALDSAAVRLTETGIALGTPAYMSPEQAGGSRVDARSDVYALGCMLYEMLAGAPPFTGPTAQAILARHATDPVPPLRTVRPQVPEAVAQAVERALAKVPADRFPSAGEFADALTAPVSARRGLRRLVPTVILVVAAAVGAASGALAWRSLGSAPSVSAATSVSVLPLSVRGDDPALLRLSQDLAVTVSASLDGVGGIETTDRLLLASEQLERRVLSLSETGALVRRLGARSFLRGSLVETGDWIRVDARLYQSDSLTPLAAPFKVVAHRDSLAAITDSITWAVLRGVWRRGRAPSPSLEAVTTRSLPALRAFLDGERELADNRWHEAGLAFASAIALDSNFVMAHFRYAMCRMWTDRTVEPQVMHVLRANRRVLTERERMLVSATLDSMSAPERLEALRAVTERYPDYWPGWFLYGDIHLHKGPRLGYDWSEGLGPFKRALELEPRLVPVLHHLDFLTFGRDVVEQSRVIEEVRARGLDVYQDQMSRLENAALRAGGIIPSGQLPLADSVARQMVDGSQPGGIELGYSYAVLRGGWMPIAQFQLNERALAIARSPDTRAALRAAMASAWAARGQWDSALAAIAEAARQRPGVVGPARYDAASIGGPALAIESYALAVVGAWLGAVDPGLGEPRRQAALAMAQSFPDLASRREALARIAWLDGLLGAARGDGPAIAAARDAALATGYPGSSLVDRSLAAFEAARRGDHRRAGHLLARLEEECAAADTCNEFTPGIAINRLAAAEWLARSGELERARRLLRYHEARSYPNWLYMLNDVLAAPTFLARARLEERIGDHERAEGYYERFLRMYDQPVSRLAHSRDDAEAALARLRAPTEPGAR